MEIQMHCQFRLNSQRQPGWSQIKIPVVGWRLPWWEMKSSENHTLHKSGRSSLLSHASPPSPLRLCPPFKEERGSSWTETARWWLKPSVSPALAETAPSRNWELSQCFTTQTGCVSQWLWCFDHTSAWKEMVPITPWPMTWPLAPRTKWTFFFNLL